MKPALSFTKMHGAGNDFVFVDRSRLGRPVTPSLARLLLDRHFGVGGDQLLELLPPRRNHEIRLRIFNADGSQAEMCGNGVRAVAHHLLTTRRVQAPFVIETLAGPIGIAVEKGRIQVDMGRPILEGSRIPMKVSGEVKAWPLTVLGRRFLIHGVSMGNPHCVIFVPSVDRVPLEVWGPAIERHALFPRRTNVEFVQVVSRRRAKVRVWERGAGITLACGTGACAVAVAAARAGKMNREVSLDLPGGQLQVRWADNDHVFLSGPVKVMFTGEFAI